MRTSCASRRTAGKPLREALDRTRHPGGRRVGSVQRQHQRRGAALACGMSVRPSGRAPDELRALSFVRGYTAHAEGSVLVGFGATRVLCTASVEEGVPSFLRGSATGLGDRRIRHAAARDAYALGARGRARQANRPHAGDPASDRPGACARWSI